MGANFRGLEPAIFLGLSGTAEVVAENSFLPWRFTVSGWSRDAKQSTYRSVKSAAPPKSNRPGRWETASARRRPAAPTWRGRL